MVPIQQRIQTARIIPVIALDDAADAVPLCQALRAGGLKVAEITFRTAAAAEAIRIVSREFPEFVLGAGTVTRIEEVDTAREAGAGFAVAPGCNPRIVRRAQEVGLEFFPGVCTPSDIEQALELGCTLLKYFPAGTMGGLKTIQTLHGRGRRGRHLAGAAGSRDEAGVGTDRRPHASSRRSGRQDVRQEG